jgi:hypothetical protein
MAFGRGNEAQSIDQCAATKVELLLVAEFTWLLKMDTAEMKIICGCEASKCGRKVSAQAYRFGQNNVCFAQWAKKNQSGRNFFG